MDYFLKNALSVVIIGDETNEKFDGKFKIKGIQDDCKYHRDAIKKIVIDFKKDGYDMGMINYMNINESGFDIVNKGHILFCNCSMLNTYLGYIFIPTKITDKQMQTLRLFEEKLQKFEALYIMKIDDLNNENFETNTFSYNFTVDQLINILNNNKTK